eukprot:1351252-Rhodomonas_salina.1
MPTPHQELPLVGPVGALLGWGGMGVACGARGGMGVAGGARGGMGVAGGARGGMGVACGARGGMGVASGASGGMEVAGGARNTQARNTYATSMLLASARPCLAVSLPPDPNSW